MKTTADYTKIIHMPPRVRTHNAFEHKVSKKLQQVQKTSNTEIIKYLAFFIENNIIYSLQAYVLRSPLKGEMNTHTVL